MIKAGVYKPKTTDNGKIIIDWDQPSRRIETTPENWATFVKGVKRGLFDHLGHP